MVRKSVVLSALFAAVAFAGGVSVSSGSALAYQCKTYPHQAIGIKKLKHKASVTSRLNWSSTAKAQLGVPWSLWSLAKDKSVTCSKLGDGRWRCLASAKPCLYVVP